MRGWAALCVVPLACAPVGDAAQVVAFEALHAPVYDVYGLRAEAGEPVDADAVWEHLARSFRGEALTREYVQHFATLRSMAVDDLAIDVEAVRYSDVRVVAARTDAFDVDATWTVLGTVTHQGHQHRRLNLYEAVYTLEEGVDGWRIVGTRLRDLERLPEVADVDGPRTLRPEDLLEAAAAEDGR